MGKALASGYMAAPEIAGSIPRLGANFSQISAGSTAVPGVGFPPALGFGRIQEQQSLG